MIPITKLWRPGPLGRKHGIPPQTMHDYVSSGRVPCVRTACGLPLISEVDLLKYIKHGRPTVGQPRKVDE